MNIARVAPAARAIVHAFLVLGLLSTVALADIDSVTVAPTRVLPNISTPILFTVQLSEETARSARAVIIQEVSNGVTRRIGTLNDRGKNGDKIKDDHVFSGTFAIRKPGLQLVKYQAVVSSKLKKVPPLLSEVTLTVADVDASIAALLPNNGPSGTTVRIIGQGFVPNSEVTIAGVSRPVQWVSESEIHAQVPLFPAPPPTALSPGIVQVTVNQTASADFNVTALPQNPNPPGVVLAQVLSLAGLDTTTPFSHLTELLSELQGSITDPASLNYIKALIEVLDPLQILTTYYLGSLSSLDANSMATFEALLLENLPDLQATNIASLGLVLPGVELCSASDGATWLNQRSALPAFQLIKIIEAITFATNAICLGGPGVGCPFNAYRISTIFKIGSVLTDVGVQTKCGVIKSLKMSPAEIDVSWANPAVVTASIDTQRQISTTGVASMPGAFRIIPSDPNLVPYDIFLQMHSLDSKIRSLKNLISAGYAGAALETSPSPRQVSLEYLTESIPPVLEWFPDEGCLAGLVLVNVDALTGVVSLQHQITPDTKPLSFSCNFSVNDDLSIPGDSSETSLMHYLVPSL